MRRNFYLRSWFIVVALLVGTPLWASEFLGSVGTESGVPIAGQEDVVIFNMTGPSQGCSTALGTPICTAVTFDNVTLTVNGTDTLNLGDIAPGMTETYTFSNGTFVDGSIMSLALAVTLSTTSLSDDLGNTYTVDAGISLSGLPVDGTYADIAASLAQMTNVPEPAYAPVMCFLLACGTVWAWVRSKNRRVNALD